MRETRRRVGRVSSKRLATYCTIYLSFPPPRLPTDMEYASLRRQYYILMLESTIRVSQCAEFGDSPFALERNLIFPEHLIEIGEIIQNVRPAREPLRT